MTMLHPSERFADLALLKGYQYGHGSMALKAKIAGSLASALPTAARLLPDRYIEVYGCSYSTSSVLSSKISNQILSIVYLDMIGGAVLLYSMRSINRSALPNLRYRP
ncbi:hypothetical protein HYFRA_00002583 [Hymenoscyphus fraxineus]|uniref:Uncharacterized protein n=1 Tax=Hymenoscyphus fraxineus TaxID=746836 RepID=A0A9N9PZH3_9HELO|nr:hypothetical protein HYFRA_00002583 [Hymenoscyphus fraxineus]